jgi:hypothetical protein
LAPLLREFWTKFHQPDPIRIRGWIARAIDKIRSFRESASGLAEEEALSRNEIAFFGRR